MDESTKDIDKIFNIQNKESEYNSNNINNVIKNNNSNNVIYYSKNDYILNLICGFNNVDNSNTTKSSLSNVIDENYTKIKSCDIDYDYYSENIINYLSSKYLPINNNVLNYLIYNNLVSNVDNYIDINVDDNQLLSIEYISSGCNFCKSLFNSNKAYKQQIYINEYKEYIKSISIYNIISIESKAVFEEEYLSIINDVYSLTRKFIELSVFNEKKFLTSINLKIEQLLNLIGNTYKIIYNKFCEDNSYNYKSNMFIFQCYLIKLNIVNTLYDLMSLYLKNDYMIHLYKIKEYNDLIKVIDSNIINILDNICENNPFLTVLMFNRNIINLLFYNKNDIICCDFKGIETKTIGNNILFENRINFFFKKLKMLNLYDYKVNCEYFTIKIIEVIKNLDTNFINNKHKSYDTQYDINTVYLDNIENKSYLDDLYSYNLYKSNLLKILNMVLITCNQSCLTNINNIITNFILEHITSNLFVNNLEFKINRLIELSNKNTNDINEIKSEQTKIDISLINTQILYTFKIINNIKKEFFILLTQHIPILYVINMLNFYNELELDIRLDLFTIYRKFIVENCFYIHRNLDMEIIKKLIKHYDLLTIGSFEIDYYIHNEQTVHNKKNDEDLLFNNYKKLSLEDTIKKSTQLYYKDFDFISESNGFLILYENLQMFKHIILKYNSDINNDNKYNLIQIFEEYVLKTCLFSIYKIILFGYSINVDTKYNIYKYVYLFCVNFKFLFEKLSVEEIIKNKNKLNIKFLDNESELKTVSNYKLNILESIENDLRDLDSNEIDHLNIKYLFRIFFYYVYQFKVYNILVKDYFFYEDINLNNLIIDKCTNNKQTITEKNIKFNINNSIEYIINNNMLIDKSISNNDLNETNIKIAITLKDFKSNNNSLLNSLFNKILYNIVDDYNKLKSNISNNIIYDIIKFNLIENANFKRIYIIDIFNKLKTNTEELHLINHNNFSYLETNPLNTSNLKIISIINRIFKLNPDIFQKILAEHNKAKDFLFYVLDKQLIFVFQFILMDSISLNSNEENNVFYKLIIEYIEFLRLTCENHNKIFQTLLINYDINTTKLNNTNIENDNNRINLMSFMFVLKVILLKYIDSFNSKKDLIKHFRSTKISYFQILSDKITDFIVEIKQGAASFNFEKIYNLSEFNSYVDDCLYFIDKIEKTEDFIPLISNFFKLINCFYEENSNNIDNKVNINKKFNLKKLKNIMIYCFKKLHYNYYGLYGCYNKKAVIYEPDFNTTVLNENYSEKHEKNIILNFSFYNIAQNSHLELIKQYIQDEELRNSYLLNIGIYIYINLLRSSYWKGGDKSTAILNELKQCSDINYEIIDYGSKSKEANKNMYNLILKKECYLFFSSLVKQVEISFNVDNKIDDKILKSYKGLFSYNKNYLLNININKLYSVDLLPNENNNYIYSLKNHIDIINDKVSNNVDTKEYYSDLCISSNTSTKTNVFDNVVFIVHPESLFIKEDDGSKFVKIAPYEHFNSKLTFFLEYFETYKNKLLMRKILWDKNSKVLNKLYNINYKTLEVFTALFGLLINLIMLINIRFLDTVNDEIIFKYDYVTNYLNLIHNILLLFLIINWFGFKLFETYKFSKIEKESNAIAPTKMCDLDNKAAYVKNSENIQDVNLNNILNKNISAKSSNTDIINNSNISKKKRFLLNSAKMYLSLFYNIEIFPFLWNFKFGVLGYHNPKLRFLLALQLFSFFNIVPTMSSVLYAVKIRYSQFASTAYLLIILVFLYTSIAYYNFRTELVDSNNVWYYLFINIIIN